MCGGEGRPTLRIRRRRGHARFGRGVFWVVTLAAVLAAFGNAAQKTAASPSVQCKVVTKKVHGKTKHVRVCRKPSLPQAGTIAATVAIGADVNDVAASDSAVWVVAADRRLLRIDPATDAIVATIPLPESEWPEQNVAVGGGSVWVTVPSPDTLRHPELDSLLRIDPTTNRIVARISVGHSPIGIAVTPSAVWTANHRSDWPSDGSPTGEFYVSRIDVASNSETARVLVETRTTPGADWDHFCCGPSFVTAAAGALWVTDPVGYGNGMVVRVDPVTNAVAARISYDNSKAVACGYVVGDETTIWVASGCRRTYVTRIDPQTNQIVATIDAGARTGALALGFGSLWGTGDGLNAGLYRIDPATNKLTGRTQVPNPGRIGIGAGSIWVASGNNLLRVTPT
jgi:Repeat of unknown function (DUF6923)